MARSWSKSQQTGIGSSASGLVSSRVEEGPMGHPIWALHLAERRSTARSHQFLLQIWGDEFLCTAWGTLSCYPKLLLQWAYIFPALAWLSFFHFPVSPSSQMTNDLLLLLLSCNSFVGVNAVLISHLVLNDAKSLAPKSLYPGIR